MGHLCVLYSQVHATHVECMCMHVCYAFAGICDTHIMYSCVICELCILCELCICVCYVFVCVMYLCVMHLQVRATHVECIHVSFVSYVFVCVMYLCVMHLQVHATHHHKHTCIRAICDG